MKCFETTVGTNGAKLTAYIQDINTELPDINIRPAMLVLPGGAYRFCADREAEPIALAYLQHGFNAFVLRYTVTGFEEPEKYAKDVFKKALADAEAAMEYIIQNAEELRIDPKRIATVGFSAGGHLAAALGTVAKVKPSAMVLGYAAVTKEVNEGLGLDGEVLLDEIDGTTPPAFLFTTQADELVKSENSLLFALELAKRKIPYELHVFATGAHGLALGTSATGRVNEDVAQWLPMSVRFLTHLWSGKDLISIGF